MAEGDGGASALRAGRYLSTGPWREFFTGQTAGPFGLFRLAPEMVLFATFVVAFEWLRRLSILPASAYEGPVILAETAQHLVDNFVIAAFAAVALAMLVWIRAEWTRGWSDFEHGRAIRVVVIAALIAMIWPLVTSRFDLLTGQLHGFDRLLLLALGIGAAFRPFLLLPALIVGGPMVWQFQSGWGGYPWEFFGMPLRVLVLVSVWLMLSAAIGAWRAKSFWYVLPILLAAHFWIPGLAKLRMGWFIDNETSYILSSSYANGWLGFLSPETLSEAMRVLASLDVPMRLAPLLIEVGCLFILMRRSQLVVGFLVGVVMFHSAIFLVSGILLWQWALIEAAVCLVVIRLAKSGRWPTFGLAHVAMSVLLILSAPLWLRSAQLSWFDMPVKYVYRFEAIDDVGARHNLDPQFFAPFDRQFALNGFDFVVEDRPLLGEGRGEYRTTLTQAGTLEELERLEEELGVVRFHEPSAEELRTFVSRYAQNRNRYGSRYDWLARMSPPPGIVTFPRDNRHDGGVIRRVEVIAVLTFAGDQDYRELREEVVMVIDIAT